MKDLESEIESMIDLFAAFEVTIIEVLSTHTHLIHLQTSAKVSCSTPAIDHLTHIWINIEIFKGISTKNIAIF